MRHETNTVHETNDIKKTRVPAFHFLGTVSAKWRDTHERMKHTPPCSVLTRSLRQLNSEEARSRAA